MSRDDDRSEKRARTLIITIVVLIVSMILFLGAAALIDYLIVELIATHEVAIGTVSATAGTDEFKLPSRKDRKLDGVASLIWAFSARRPRSKQHERDGSYV